MDRSAIVLDGRCAWPAGTPPCTAVARLLVVHHTTSPRRQALLEAVLSGAGDGAIQDVTVLARPALAATAIDVLGADGDLLGTPATLGYAPGALQHFLGQIDDPCLGAALRRPYGPYVHGDGDPPGAVRAVEAITRGLGWRRAQARWRCSATRAGRTSRPAGSLAPRWRQA